MVSLLLLGLAMVCIVNGQYFSSSDGVNLPRSGKRSYLTSLLKNLPDQQADDQQQQQQSGSGSSTSSFVNLDGPSYYQTDKLSYRRLLNKMGRRFVEPDTYFGSGSSANDYISKEALFNYLYNQLHKLKRNRGQELSTDWDVEVDVPVNTLERK